MNWNKWDRGLDYKPKWIEMIWIKKWNKVNYELE